ncbi:MAG: hypothetical protein V3S05_10230, partial [Desulfobacterales bacterium]
YHLSFLFLLNKPISASCAAKIEIFTLHPQMDPVSFGKIDFTKGILNHYIVDLSGGFLRNRFTHCCVLKHPRL